MTDALLTPAQAAELLAVNLRTMQYLREKNTGPAYIRLGPKLIRYRRSDIDAFLQKATN